MCINSTSVWLFVFDKQPDYAIIWPWKEIMDQQSDWATFEVCPLYFLCIIMDFVGHVMLGGGKVQMLWSNLNSLNWYYSGWWKQFLFILFLGEGLCNSWEEPVQGILTPGSSLYPAQKLPLPLNWLCVPLKKTLFDSFSAWSTPLMWYFREASSHVLYLMQ